MKNNINGFTLVELSIVLVIIGLVVSVVIVGQSLVSQAQLRSVINEQAQVKAAINAFRLEYNGLPGDISNASSYWSMGCRGDADMAQTSDAAECDGNGNGSIELFTIIPPSAFTVLSEGFMAWLHLNRAGLYPGEYIPDSNNGTFPTSIANTGVNIPESKFTGAGISLTSANLIEFASGFLLNSTNETIILFGAEKQNDPPTAPIFLVNQASAIDRKIDDGQPETGIVWSRTANTGAVIPIANYCTNIARTAYNLANTSVITCIMAFPL